MIDSTLRKRGIHVPYALTLTNEKMKKSEARGDGKQDIFYVALSEGHKRNIQAGIKITVGYRIISDPF